MTRVLIVLGDIFCVVQSVAKRAESTTRDKNALGFGGYEFPFVHINEQLRSMLIYCSYFFN
jgi:hypothetical protein